MLWIVITPPEIFSGEARFISRLLAAGVDIVHLRKPKATDRDCAALLDGLTPVERGRIVIHDFFELAAPYGLRGVHLNSRRSEVPVGHKGSVSCSCHSLEEVVRYKAVSDYVFLSPIFDSVSKQGYASAFTSAELRQACLDGIIDGKVVALGGVIPDKVPFLRSHGFGGAAMLGCVANLAKLTEAEQIEALEQIRRKVKER